MHSWCIMGRLNLNLSDEVIERLDVCYKYVGLPSRTALIEQILRAAVYMNSSYDGSSNIMTNFPREWHRYQERKKENKDVQASS